MNEIELMTKYKEMVARIKEARMFDGRNGSVDVYVCQKCGRHYHTRYMDKGVTPFTIQCRGKGCNGTMVHEDTIDEIAAMLEKLTVHNWVRPSLDWLKTQLKEHNGVIEHVLNGGLILEDEL